ncbi:DUF4129 domain-containing protein [Chitinophaga lutea]
MRTIYFVLLPLLLTTGLRAVAQSADTLVPAAIIVDTTVVADELVEEKEEEDEEDEAASDVESKLRNGGIPHQMWDDQEPGEWDEAGGTHFSRRAVDAENLRKLRDTKELQYKTGKVKAEEKRSFTFTAERYDAMQTGLLWLLGGLLLAVLIYFILQNDLPVFRWGRARLEGPEVVHAGPQGPFNFDAAITAAQQTGDYREAVRLRYLQSLRHLEDRQLIALGKDKTNRDYVRALSATAWHKPFTVLTRYYEYVWYGRMPLSGAQYDQLAQEFSHFSKSLRS